MFIACKKEPVRDGGIRQETIDIVPMVANKNAIVSGYLNQNELNVLYNVDGKMISYPYSSDVYPKGFTIVDLKGEKAIRIHLNSNVENNAITMINYGANKTAVIKANFLKTENMVRFVKIWYNDQLIFDIDNPEISSNQVFNINLD